MKVVNSSTILTVLFLLANFTHSHTQTLNEFIASVITNEKDRSGSETG